MRIVNTMCISKEKTVKAVRHFADVIVKVFEENSEITLGGGGGGGQEGGVECQLRKSKSCVCLDQNWMFVDRGEEGSGGPKFRLFW